MDILISSLISLLIEISKEPLEGIRGRIKLHCIKKRLKRDIFTEILKRYGNEVYYNDLDQFLTSQNVICTIIRNNIEASLFDYKSQSQMTTYYIQMFVEKHPKYKKYHYEVSTLIDRYFKVIFKVLNPINSEATRTVCNVTTELIKELAITLTENDTRIENKIDNVNTKIDQILESQTVRPTRFLKDRYFLYLSSIYSNYLKTPYLERKIYDSKDVNVKFDALDALLEEKRY